MGLVETIKRERSKAGDTTTKGNGNFDATGRLKTVQKKPNAKEILDRMETKKKTTKKITKQGTSKPKPPQVTVQMLIDAVKDVEGLTTDTDKNGFVNFREGKRIIVYAIDRKQFFNYSTRDSSTKTGWKGTRITSQDELEVVAESLRKQFTERSIRQASLTPIETFNCKFKGCKYCTNDRAQMEQHLNQH